MTTIGAISIFFDNFKFINNRFMNFSLNHEL